MKTIFDFTNIIKFLNKEDFDLTQAYITEAKETVGKMLPEFSALSASLSTGETAGAGAKEAASLFSDDYSMNNPGFALGFLRFLSAKAGFLTIGLSAYGEGLESQKALLEALVGDPKMAHIEIFLVRDGLDSRELLEYQAKRILYTKAGIPNLTITVSEPTNIAAGEYLFFHLYSETLFHALLNSSDVDLPTIAAPKMPSKHEITLYANTVLAKE